MTEGAGTDDGADIRMEPKGNVVEDGYTVEVAIPLTHASPTATTL
jgi:hypothetical protein